MIQHINGLLCGVASVASLTTAAVNEAFGAACPGRGMWQAVLLFWLAVSKFRAAYRGKAELTFCGRWMPRKLVEAYRAAKGTVFAWKGFTFTSLDVAFVQSLLADQPHDGADVPVIFCVKGPMQNCVSGLGWEDMENVFPPMALFRLVEADEHPGGLIRADSRELVSFQFFEIEEVTVVTPAGELLRMVSTPVGADAEADDEVFLQRYQPLRGRIGNASAVTAFIARDRARMKDVCVRRVRKGMPVARRIAEARGLLRIVRGNAADGVRAHDLNRLLCLPEELEGSRFLYDVSDWWGLHFRRFAEATLPVGEVALMLHVVAQGLSLIHGNEIVHGRVDRMAIVKMPLSGQIKLGGLTDLQRPGKQSGERARTPLWEAPELRDRDEALQATDIWTLGATALELWRGAAAVKAATAAADGAIEEPPDLSLPEQLLWRLLDEMMSRDPNVRPFAEGVAKRAGRVARALGVRGT